MAEGQAENAKTALQGGQKAACISLNRLYSIVKVLFFDPDPRSGIIELSKCEFLYYPVFISTYPIVITSGIIEIIKNRVALRNF